jgi:hypothetical protein
MLAYQYLSLEIRRRELTKFYQKKFNHTQNKIIMKTNFIQAIIAKLKGEDAETRAKKIQNKALSAFTAEIAVQEPNLLDLEENVENARVDVEEALINGAEPIKDRVAYLRNYMAAQERLQKAEDDLQAAIEQVQLLKAGKKAVEAGDFFSFVTNVEEEEEKK